jgi:hypothetical protein
MLPSIYSKNPFNTTRPKSFFADRKKMMLQEIAQGSGGLSYNSSWNAHYKATPKTNAGAKSNSILNTPWSVMISVILCCITTIL